MKYLENIQKLLPIGYLCLVIIGLSEETIFYGQLGINIIRYSALMDIFMSPIAVLTSNVPLAIALLFLAAASYILFKILPNYAHKTWAIKLLKIEGKSLTKEELSETAMWFVVKNFVSLLFGFFFGIGVAEGNFTVKKIRNNKIAYNHTLTYSSGESDTIYMVGSNSCYYFYITKGDKNVKISPIGAIKSIELTDNKRLK